MSHKSSIFSRWSWYVGEEPSDLFQRIYGTPSLPLFPQIGNVVLLAWLIAPFALVTVIMLAVELRAMDSLEDSYLLFFLVLGNLAILAFAIASTLSAGLQKLAVSSSTPGRSPMLNRAVLAFFVSTHLTAAFVTLFHRSCHGHCTPKEPDPGSVESEQDM